MAWAARHGPRAGGRRHHRRQPGGSARPASPRSPRRRSDRGWPAAARSPRHGGTSRRQVESVPIPARHSRHRSANFRGGAPGGYHQDINVRRAGRPTTDQWRPSRPVRDPAPCRCAPPQAPMVGGEGAAGLAERGRWACRFGPPPPAMSYARSLAAIAGGLPVFSRDDRVADEHRVSGVSTPAVYPPRKQPPIRPRSAGRSIGCARIVIRRGRSMAAGRTRRRGDIAERAVATK
jgi:hypothetical protein